MSTVDTSRAPFPELEEEPSLYVFWNEDGGCWLCNDHDYYLALAASLSDEDGPNSVWLGVGTPVLVPVAVSMKRARDIAMHEQVGTNSWATIDSISLWNGSTYERIDL